ncbi:MAG TPA: response regulator [Bryobacteraceae bacterium]|nr:response regulator [Bryobacteraceae bacterium]
MVPQAGRVQIRVLVVDDEPGVRTLVANLLRGRGYSVAEACGGEEALDVASRESNKIDLLLSDVSMPGVDGPTLAERLLATKRVAKVLFISGFSDAPVRRFRAEQVAFLAKPFRPEELFAAVRRLTERHALVARTA